MRPIIHNILRDAILYPVDTVGQAVAGVRREPRPARGEARARRAAQALHDNDNDNNNNNNNDNNNNDNNDNNIKQ